MIKVDAAGTTEARKSIDLADESNQVEGIGEYRFGKVSREVASLDDRR